MKYYKRGVVNPNVEKILQCNELFCNRTGTRLADGKGGGVLKTLEVIADAVVKNELTKPSPLALWRSHWEKPLTQQSTNYYNLPTKTTSKVNGSWRMAHASWPRNAPGVWTTTHLDPGPTRLPWP